MVYVQVDRIMTNVQENELKSRLERLQFADNAVRYYGGGWGDKRLTNIEPHLTFSHEDDAIVYSLAYGGIVKKTIPLQPRGR